MRLNTRLKARHLYAPTQQKADVLYASLLRGETFERLARQAFSDEKLQNSGGDLGYFSVDEMEPGFEDAAFSLQEGEISRPVKTSDGYSIIRVEDRQTKPLITESEYAKHRHKLYPYWKNRKVKKAIQAFSDSLGRSLAISFDQRVLEKLYSSLQQNEQSGLANEPAKEFEKISHRKLVSSKFETWTVGDFQEKAKFTGPQHQDRIRNLEQFKEFISGLIVREQVLRLARKRRLHKSEEYLDQVEKEWDIYLLTRMEQTLRDEMLVPDDSIRAYYERNKSKFMRPAAINLREIVLNSMADAKLIAAKLADGVAFEKLARRFSERAWSAKRGGEMGFLTSGDFGRWADAIFALQPGERKGPVLMDSKYVFLECIEKRPAQQKDLSESWPEIEAAVRYIMHDDYRRKRISEFGRDIDRLVRMPARLNTLTLN